MTDAMTTETVRGLTIAQLSSDGLTVVMPVSAKQGETLPMLQEAVGGYVDCFDIAHPETGDVATVWFHDEGKINGLSNNLMAEFIAVLGGWTGPSDFGDWIAGPVVLTGFDAESGETTSLPEAWAQLVANVIDAMS